MSTNYEASDYAIFSSLQLLLLRSKDLPHTPPSLCSPYNVRGQVSH